MDKVDKKELNGLLHWYDLGCLVSGMSHCAAAAADH